MFDGKTKITLDDLDKLVTLIRQGNGSEAMAMQHYRALEIPEKLYVGLATSKLNLLGGKNVAYAFNRIGTIWQKELITRHQYD